MKCFFRDQAGNAILWSLFLILILCTLSVIIYSTVTMYANYQTAEADLQRAATMSADISLENANVRDMQLDIPDCAETQLEDNLTEASWVKEDNGWARYDEDEKLYSIKDMQIEIDGMTMQIKATFVMSLPWKIGDIDEFRIPMRVRSSILYMN
jgi:hypothetical protein